MNRGYLLAAEMYHYSYDNYADHIEVENPRFTEYMPRHAALVEQADKEGWSDERLAKALECDLEIAVDLRESYREAVAIIDQKTPDRIFRQGVIASIKYALEKGLKTEEDIDALAGQICYRAADLSYLLTCEGSELRDYSEALRNEPDEWTLDNDGETSQ